MIPVGDPLTFPMTGALKTWIPCHFRTAQFGKDHFLQEPQAEENDLDGMTKAELLDWAMDQGHDLKNALPKAQILLLCKEIELSL